MKAALAALIFAVAALSAEPAAAELSAGEAARLANAAFDVVCDKIQGGHSPMDAATVRWRGDRRFAWFHTNFFMSDTADGFAIFAVDRRTGAVWSVSYEKCIPIEGAALDEMRASLPVTRGAAHPPSRRYCHL